MSLKLKIKECPNYDKIVNFLYEENDEISKFLIDCYRQYIANIKSNKSLYNIDNIMGIYILKESFYKCVQEYFNINNSSELFDSYDKVILKLNKIYKNYEQERLKKVNPARWL